jgi:hypothetical protein
MFPVALLARMILARFLLDPAVKKQVLVELRLAAKGTDNALDDRAVDNFETIWDIVVPVLLKKT